MVNWGNYDILIIGGGPSLDDIDIEKEREGRKTIVVNSAIALFQDADAGVFIDKKVTDYAEYFKLPTFQGVLFTTPKSGYSDERTIIVKPSGKTLTRDIQHGVYTAGNSGVMALSIALLLTTGDVYLAGFDGGAVDGRMYHRRCKEQHDAIGGVGATHYNDSKIMKALSKRWEAFEPENHRIINLSNTSILPLPKRDDASNQSTH